MWIVKLTCIGIAILISFFIVVNFCKRDHSINLGGKFSWKLIHNNDSVIYNKQNKILVGPGNIALWAKYPWIYGDINVKQEVSYFAINVETEEMFSCDGNKFIDFRKENDISLDLSLLVTFFDIAAGRQWQNKQKAEKLKLILKGAKE